MPLLLSPDRSQKRVVVAGATFKRTSGGYFEIPNETIFVEPLLAQGFQKFLPTAKDGSVIVPENVKQAELEAVIIRCTCGDEGRTGLIKHPGRPCPNGRAVNLGVIASYYRNPFKRLWKYLVRSFNRPKLQEN